MSKRKEKLYIDIETVSTDFGTPGRVMIAAYRLGNGPIEVIEFDHAQPGRQQILFVGKPFETPLPYGDLLVDCPALGIFPERSYKLCPHFAGLGYKVYDVQNDKFIGNIPTQNVKDNLENGFYILQPNNV